MLKDLLTVHKASFKDYTELRAQMNQSNQVTFLNGSMVGNVQAAIGGVSARVYKGGTFGFASGAEYSKESVENVLNAATENAIFMDTRVNRGLPPLAVVPPQKFEVNQRPENAVNQSFMIDFLKELDSIIEKKYTNLSSRTVMAGGLNIEKLLVVSDGADSHFIQPRSSVRIIMTAETNDGVPVELAEKLSAFGDFDELYPNPEALLEKVDKLYESVMQLREGVYAKAGTHKCILHPALAGMLAHEAVGHTVEADFVRAGSVAGHYLNKQVASELVTMVDFAHTAMGKTCPLPVYVDDEGVVAEDVTLIEKGILKSYMHSRETARHFGVKPQGNARAFAFSDEPLVRMRNTAILPGMSKLEDMIASIDEGYYLVETGNGQADSTGEVMFSVDLGYEIKNGKLGKAIRETTISGVAFEMLKTVDMLSDDIHWDAGGYCGKKQIMTVSMGGPAIRCDMNIGGR